MNFTHLRQLYQNPAFWFFTIFFFIGLFSFTDYGLGWDDEWSRTATGYANFNYIFNGDNSLLTNNEKYHGPFVELLLVFAEKISGLTDTADVYYLRHFLLFALFFCAVIAFYAVAKNLYGTFYGLIGCLMLVLSPRIFSDAFFNSKDLAFLSLFTIGLYFFIKFVKNPTIKWALIYAFITGAIIDTRILGIMLPLLTIGYILLFNFLNKIPRKSLISLLVYIVATLIFIILFWPILWENPYHHFVAAFVEMKKFHWDGHVFFNNHPVHTSSLPWYYIPVWVCITTPIMYVILISMGLLIFIRQLIINPFKELLNELEIFSVFVLLTLPVASVVLLNSVVYDGWRHLFFIYPLLIIMSLYGIKKLIKFIEKIKYAKEGFFAFLFFNMIFIGFWMVKNHPFQNVYFSTFSRKYFEVGRKFELDYWGISYKQGLEYLSENIKDTDTIIYTSLNLPGKINHMIINEKNRSKLKYVEPHDSTWVYYLTNFRGAGDPENTELLHKISIDNIPIMGVYKRK